MEDSEEEGCLSRSVSCKRGGAAGLGCHDCVWDGEQERPYGSFEPRWVNEVTCSLYFLVCKTIFFTKNLPFQNFFSKCTQ